MNQILNTPKKILKYVYFFKILLIISLFVIATSIIYMFYLNYKKDEKAKISKLMLNSYSISKLYSDTSFYFNKPSYPYVIGTLEIPSISLNLPILSEMNDDLLTLSACRFYGPMPNEVR